MQEALDLSFDRFLMMMIKIALNAVTDIRCNQIFRGFYPEASPQIYISIIVVHLSIYLPIPLVSLSHFRTGFLSKPHFLTQLPENVSLACKDRLSSGMFIILAVYIMLNRLDLAST